MTTMTAEHGPAADQCTAVQYAQAILSNVGQVMFLLLVTLLQGGMLKTFQEELKGDYHSVARSIFGFLAYWP